MYLSQATAITIIIGSFVDVSTRIPDDSIDVTDISVDLFSGTSINSLTITSSGGDNDMVAVGSLGMYSLELTASDLGTMGLFTVVAYVTGYEVVKQEYIIIDQPVYLAFQGDANGFIKADLARINDDDFPVTTLETLLVDYSTDGAIHANIFSISGDTDAADALEIFFDQLGVAGPDGIWDAYRSPLLARFSVSSVTGTSIELTGVGTLPDDAYVGLILIAVDPSGAYKESKRVVSFDTGTDIIEVDSAFTIVDDTLIDYVTIWDFSLDGASGTMDANLVSVNGTTQTADVIEEVFVTDAATVKNSFADALLKRDWTGMVGEASRSALNALRFLRNRRSIVAGVLNVTGENDVDIKWSANLTTSSSAEPITDIDPT